MKENKENKEIKVSKNKLARKNEMIVREEKIETNSNTFDKIMFLYRAALKEVNVKMEIIKEQVELLNNYKLIEHMSSRIKDPESIVNKMKKKNCDMTYQGLIEEVNDVAGIRIICNLRDDIFTIASLIRDIPGMSVLKEKDYVTNTKKSGYSSYHMIIEVPLNLFGENINIKVEVQIRTIAMDFWASLEHEIKYKTDKKVTKKMTKELLNCAKLINKIDVEMTNMYRR